MMTGNFTFENTISGILPLWRRCLHLIGVIVTLLIKRQFFYISDLQRSLKSKHRTGRTHYRTTGVTARWSFYNDLIRDILYHLIVTRRHRHRQFIDSLRAFWPYVTACRCDSGLTSFVQWVFACAAVRDGRVVHVDHDLHLRWYTVVNLSP